MFKPECTRAGAAPLVTLQASAPISSTAPVLMPSPELERPAPPLPVESTLDNFTETVRNFVAIDKRIAELASEMKALRGESGRLKEAICVFMEERDIEDLHTRTMRLKLKTSLVKPPLKKAELRARVSEYLGGDEQAAEFFAKVYEREGVEKTCLRRINTRKN